MKQHMISKSIPNRNITLAEVTQQAANDVIRAIYDANTEDQKLAVEKRTPINLIINSEGGDVYSGFGIVEAIIHSVTPVHTICHGQAQSMAMLILAAGHKRYIGSYSTLMYHEINWDVEFSPGNFHRQELDEANRMQEVYDNLLLRFTNLTNAQLSIIKNQGKYWYMSSEDAMRFNIVDEIL
jgi:ATP-dependent Clp protease protease subunit